HRCLLRRSAAIHSSREFAICNLLAVRAKVLKQDARRGSGQNSPATNDPHCSWRNISERNSLVRAPRHRFRRNFARESADLRVAILKYQCAGRKVRDYFCARKNSVCTGQTPPSHLERAKFATLHPRQAIKTEPAIRRDLCESRRARKRRLCPRRIRTDSTRRTLVPETAVASMAQAAE